MKQYFTFLFLFAILTGCGQTGPLYLPSPKQATSATQSSPVINK